MLQRISLRIAGMCEAADIPSVERTPAFPYASNHLQKNPEVSNTLKSVTPVLIIYVRDIRQLSRTHPKISGQQ
jgi:hypothetical protein